MSKGFLEIPSDSAWTFKNADVAEAFDDHVREQLPWYDVVTEAVRHLILAYIPETGVLYDMGCSTGNMTYGFDALGDRNVNVYGFDNSREMIDLYQGQGEVLFCDIAYPQHEIDDALDAPNVIVFFLSLMFVPPQERTEVLYWAMKRIERGGAVIVVDKTPGVGGYLGTVLSRMAIKFKLLAGASPENILKKELSLNGIQVPIDMGKHEHFKEWFRMGEFAGYIFEKAEL
tara:strand:- start:540 stop:1229 length:690 start_codon:yes stop_codon:yes gene_type:complete